MFLLLFDVDLLPRAIEPTLVSLIESSPVVILEGGRASGKSTVCDRLIERFRWSRRVDLSDSQTLDLLRLDSERFLGAQPSPCFVDEAQLEPAITVAVKRIVDRTGQAGQFVLTGSARLGRHGLGGSDPLAGRAVRIRLQSLTQSELERRPTEFIERAFGSGWDTSTPAVLALPALSASPRNAWLGGLPGVSGVLEGVLAPTWEREIAGYVEGVIPLGVAGTRADLGRLLRTFRYFASNSGQLLNLARAASELSMQAATVRNQLEELEGCFLLQRVEAHRPAEHRVVTAHPRVFASDPGLAYWAARGWATEPNAALRGSLLETVVAHDVSAAAEASPDRIVTRHWRDNRNTREVDLMLVHPDGRLVAIEVKAATVVGPRDTVGLQAFANEVGTLCHRGIVVYEGQRILDLTPPGSKTQLVAIPRTLL